MRFHNFYPVPFLLLLQLIASENALDPQLEGMADICFCVDIIYENLAKDNEGFHRAREYLGSPKGITMQLNISEGIHRLALVKLDHNGYQVLMYLNEPHVQSKLKSISETHFKDGQDQRTQRKTPLKDIFDNITKEVFAPEKGDRPAPNIMVYVHLTEKDDLRNFEHNKPYLDAGFDMVAGLTTYNRKPDRDRGDPTFFRLYDKGTLQYYDFIVGSGTSDWHLNRWILNLTNMCKGKSTYTYTNCYYVQNPAIASSPKCGKYKDFKPPANVPYCWQGEFWEMEHCDDAECDKTCELLFDTVGPCNGPCNSTGSQTHIHGGTNKQGKYCRKDVTCTGTCAPPRSTWSALPPAEDSPPKVVPAGGPVEHPGTIPAPPATGGFPVWAAMVCGIAAIMITVVGVTVGCLHVTTKRKSMTQGKDKTTKEDESKRRAGNVSNRSNMAPRGRKEGVKKNDPKVSLRESTKPRYLDVRRSDYPLHKTPPLKTCDVKKY